MKFRLGWLLVLGAVAAVVPAEEPESPDPVVAPHVVKIPASVWRYHAATTALRGRTGRTGLVPLWRLADTASAQLLDSLEALSDSSFARAESLMVGFILARADQVFVEPDLAYFDKLATQRGLPEDQAYFRFGKQYLYRRHTWAWREQNCDYCWCSRVGSPMVVDGYLAAESVLRAFPGRYDAWIVPLLRQTDSTFARANCVCENRKKALAGVEASLARLPPGHPLRQPFEAGRKFWSQKGSDVKFSCTGE